MVNLKRQLFRYKCFNIANNRGGGGGCGGGAEEGTEQGRKPGWLGSRESGWTKEF